jgi:hypothetical protein
MVPQGDIFFVPQRPYVVLGTLRDQLLYPTWAKLESAELAASSSSSSNGNGAEDGSADDASKATATAEAGSKSGGGDANPTSSSSSGGDGGTASIREGFIGSTSGSSSSNGNGSTGESSARSRRPLPGDAELRSALRAVQLGPLLERVGGNLDALADWAATLSLGEQQRLAFARVLLSKVGPGWGPRAVVTGAYPGLRLGWPGLSAATWHAWWDVPWAHAPGRLLASCRASVCSAQHRFAHEVKVSTCSSAPIPPTCSRAWF